MESTVLAALRVLTDCAEYTIEKPLPLVKQNKRYRLLGMAIKLARETILTVAGRHADGVCNGPRIHLPDE